MVNLPSPPFSSMQGSIFLFDISWYQIKRIKMCRHTNLSVRGLQLLQFTAVLICFETLLFFLFFLRHSWCKDKNPPTRRFYVFPLSEKRSTDQMLILHSEKKQPTILSDNRDAFNNLLRTYLGTFSGTFLQCVSNVTQEGTRQHSHELTELGS